MSTDNQTAELERHNQLQRIRLEQLRIELQQVLGREPTSGEIAEAITGWFGKYFREVDSDLNIWGTGEELNTDPRAMAPEDAIAALERHHLRFCPPPNQPPLYTCEDST